jgi:environmental stress-induced protein Ves
MPLHRFDLDQLAATPWKNGGGVTREMACEPAGAGIDDFDWRVSMAHIGRSGPFSAFPGVDRVITLLEGAGVHLHSDDDRVDHRLDCPLQPFRFAGETALQADLLGGDSDDLNVMTRRARCTAQVEVLHASTAWPAARQGLLLAVRGHWQVLPDSGPAQTLLARQGLWWNTSHGNWRLQGSAPGAALVAVRIEASTP